jgi:glycosyltransferase involved in cell wall biosynthesis
MEDNSLEFQIYGKGFPFNDLIKDDQRIKYLGFLPEEKIVETYNSFDVYLSTSTVEGFGLPIIQAKACKVPVLCYDGEIPEIVKRNTLLWNDDNLSEIIKNRAWEKVDVEKAYLDAEECRADKVVPKIIEVYKKVFE